MIDLRAASLVGDPCVDPCVGLLTQILAVCPGRGGMHRGSDCLTAQLLLPILLTCYLRQLDTYTRVESLR